MKKYFVIFCLISIFGLIIINSESYEDKIDKKVLDDFKNGIEKVNVIVKLKEPLENKGFFVQSEKSDKKKLLEKNKIKSEIINEIGEENINHVFNNEISLSLSIHDLELLEKNNNVDYIWFDKSLHAFLQGSVPYVNATNTWNVQISGFNVTGTNETICILDTGVDFTHPALNGKNLTCVIDCFEKACVENCSVLDDHGHGTHVAGIAGASTYINGVAVGANLIGVKVLNYQGSGTSTDLNRGIDWCIANKNAYNISVISMSLGDCSNHTTYCNSDPSASHIDNATNNNISVIVAAGNGNSGGCTGITVTIGPSAPACVQSAVAVGAVSDADSSIYYQRGPLFELFAPGININSTKANGGFESLSGTSMSAPHVSGIFALFKQFLRLTNQTKTNNEIKAVINNTGHLLDDTSGSGYNFSIVDIYSAIYSLDNLAPNVTLISPSNSLISINFNQTFVCNVTDEFLLSNLLFYLWNSAGNLINQTSSNISGLVNQSSFNVTGLSSGIYYWNCLGNDSKSNSAYANSNYTLTIGNLSTTLNSPINNTYTNQNLTFNCSGQTMQGAELTNLTFYLWNSTSDLIYNLTSNLSGEINSTIFSYNFTDEGNYFWNCLTINNQSNSDLANENYTLTYDITSPNITLISPENSASYTSSSQSITFSYNVSENINLSNCSLIVNDAISLTNISIVNLSETQSFTNSFIPGSYNWNINCTDKAGNINYSSQRSFTVTAPAVVASSGGGGGGGSPSVSIYAPTSNDLLVGYSKELKEKEQVKFTITGLEKSSHTLTLNSLKNNKVNITIKSEPINLLLGIGESKKLNVTSNEYYDLYIKFEGIKNNKASITIKTIFEEINPKIYTIIEENKSETLDSEKEIEEKIEEDFGTFDSNKKVFYFLLILFIIIFILFIILNLRHYQYNQEMKLLKKFGS